MEDPEEKEDPENSRVRITYATCETYPGKDMKSGQDP
jgi:hypothetical protein